jgi:hypothetical protein
MVTERNWLDVYPYQSWGGNANLPPLAQGEVFVPTELLLKEVRGRVEVPALTEFDQPRGCSTAGASGFD